MSNEEGGTQLEDSDEAVGSEDPISLEDDSNSDIDENVDNMLRGTHNQPCAKGNVWVCNNQRRPPLICECELHATKSIITLFEALPIDEIVKLSEIGQCKIPTWGSERTEICKKNER